jgi:DNA-binding LytR/AlgR family response regulator
MKIKLYFHPLKMEVTCNSGDIEMIPYNDILYLVYDKPYTTLCYIENKKEKKNLLEISLTYMEQNLPAVFFRCNPGVIFNLCYFRKYEHHRSVIVMENGMEFPVSRRKISLFQSKKTLLPRLSPLCEPCLICSHDCPARDSFCNRMKEEMTT